ncbi:hypothetical protein [Luteitalea pratensis]|uniref:hypothetical protein n=1 Tax=Luteitalea pratensis TaxID=1855912 RepID=UPI001F1B8C0D|nr:hypothetical protein [Luteitalea pratensis]
MRFAPVLVGLAVLLLSTPAQAALFEVQVTGLVTVTSPRGGPIIPTGAIPDGSMFTFLATVDSSIPMAACPNGGATYQALTNIALTAGSLVWTRAVGNVEVDANECNWRPLPIDNVRFRVSNMGASGPYSLNELRSAAINLLIVEFSGSPGNTIPFPFNNVALFAGPEGGGMNFTIHDTSTRSVPEPSVLQLSLLVAVAATGRVRARRC